MKQVMRASVIQRERRRVVKGAVGAAEASAGDSRVSSATRFAASKNPFSSTRQAARRAKAHQMLPATPAHALALRHIHDARREKISILLPRAKKTYRETRT